MKHGLDGEAATPESGAIGHPYARARRAARQRCFLVALAECGNVRVAAQAAGISRGTAYEWRDTDPNFKADWENAMEEAGDNLETEARRRAVEGVEEPVFQGGRQVGFIRRYFDTLLIFLLRGARPEKYGPIRTGNRVQVNVGQPLQQQINQTNVLQLSPERQALLDELEAGVRAIEARVGADRLIEALTGGNGQH